MSQAALAVLWLLLGVPLLAQAAPQPPAFSVTGLQGWFPRAYGDVPHTQYSVVIDHGTRVVSARCRDSASGLLWRGHVNLGRTPILQWRWKVNRIFRGIDEMKASGDDFPARVYVVTGTEWLPWTLKCLCYVWSNGYGHGAGGRPVWSSPYSGLEKVIAVRRGGQAVGRWQVVRRNVAKDFRMAFGARVEEVGAVGIMTDCDNSDNHARAWYGDLHFASH